MVIKLAELGYTIRLRTAADTSGSRELAQYSETTGSWRKWSTSLGCERLLSGWRYASKTDKRRKLTHARCQRAF